MLGDYEFMPVWEGQYRTWERMVGGKDGGDSGHMEGGPGGRSDPEEGGTGLGYLGQMLTSIPGLIGLIWTAWICGHRFE